MTFRVKSSRRIVTHMTDADEPRWLTPGEQRAWVALAGTVIWLPATLDAQLQRDAGISHAEYQVLSWLSMSTDRTRRMSELADTANVTLSHLSRIVARLEQRSWVRRTPDPADGRYTLAILTEDGWRKVVASAPGHVAAVREHVFDQLTPTQVAQLEEIGAQIFRHLRPDCATGHVAPVDAAAEAASPGQSA
ncbi:MarR family transcriptional regulator [Cellulomonas soli]|uniref:MarR family transcriptional regulator n=2 Tax=Cellulomonas soli TaxID=931535 RepID=A0A512PAR8_9CELL|nr:MarR family transcriptional regulator [Cellulomonas soli]